MKSYKTGIIFGAFDLLHAGHIHLFKQAKRYCDYLIIGLHVDPSVERDTKNKPIESIVARTIRLEGCKYVNKIVVYQTEAELSILLKYLKPDVRFLGSDYADWVGETRKPITDENSVVIQYIDSLDIHTSDIRERINA